MRHVGNLFLAAPRHLRFSVGHCLRQKLASVPRSELKIIGDRNIVIIESRVAVRSPEKHFSYDDNYMNFHSF